MSKWVFGAAEDSRFIVTNPLLALIKRDLIDPSSVGPVDHEPLNTVFAYRFRMGCLKETFGHIVALRREGTESVHTTTPVEVMREVDRLKVCELASHRDVQLKGQPA